MPLNPELINKFHQSFKMAQIHSAMGIYESNIALVMGYIHESYLALQEAKELVKPNIHTHGNMKDITFQDELDEIDDEIEEETAGHNSQESNNNASVGSKEIENRSSIETDRKTVGLHGQNDSDGKTSRKA